MEVPGFAAPAHQYGTAGRELDETETEELAAWERAGFVHRTEESTT